MRRTTRIALAIWAAVTSLILASIAIIYLRLGAEGFGVFIQQWPLTNLPITLASTSITWLLGGRLL